MRVFRDMIFLVHFYKVVQFLFVFPLIRHLQGSHPVRVLLPPAKTCRSEVAYNKSQPTGCNSHRLQQPPAATAPAGPADQMAWSLQLKEEAARQVCKFSGI